MPKNEPEMLSELITQLQGVHAANGDMKVFVGDMKRLEVEVVTAPEEPERHGLIFLDIGPAVTTAESVLSK